MPVISGSLTQSEKKCSLCGLPLGRKALSSRINGQEMLFCCPGCKAVYQVLLARHGAIPQDPTQTELYRECLRAGIIFPQEREEGKETLEAGDLQAEDCIELCLHVSGMGCPACAWLLEKVLEKSQGVKHAQVSFGSDKARILYQPSQVSPKEIVKSIDSLGYRAFPQTEDGAKLRVCGSRIRLGVSVVLSAHVMMISWALYLGFLEELSRESVLYLSIPLLGLSTPVVFWCGLPVLRKGLLGIRHLVPNLESLVGLGAVSAYFYSLVQFFSGNLHLYFDTASMLMTLVLLGRHLEQTARNSVKGAWWDGIGARLKKARLLEDGASPRWVGTREVRKGDLVLVDEDEGVPVDGLVEEGAATLDVSMLTGESRPVAVRHGHKVLAGSFVLKGSLKLRAKEHGEGSLLASMASMVEEALSRPWTWERTADQVARWFVPLVAALGVGTAAWLWGKGAAMEDALLRGLTVLVVACPCALGVATPLAKVAAVGLARRLSVFIKDPEVLEAGGLIQSLVLDKTGTLTKGIFSVQELICPGEKPESLLFRASSVELSSGHFLGRVVVDYARNLGIEPVEAAEFQEEPGQGVCGLLDGMRVCVGNRAWMARWRMQLHQDLDKEALIRESQGYSVIFVGWDGRTRGALVLGDRLKPGAHETISALKRQGFEIWLVSGDSPITTSWIAGQLGLERFLGGAMPQDKVALVRKLSAQGKKVCVVGDGVNDAPALASAHLGIALGNNAAPPSKAASVQTTRTDPEVILVVLEILRKARRTVLQNLLFSLLYNLSAIPAAMAGFLSPPLAVIIMFASSLTVVGNSRRLLGEKICQETNTREKVLP